MIGSKIVIWGMSVIDSSEEGNTKVEWWQNDDCYMKFTSVESDATPIKVENAIELMFCCDSILHQNNFVLKFVH